MSYWTRKGKAVYIYTHQSGKNVPLPRSQTRHLDSYSDANIDAYVAQIDGRHAPCEIPTILEKMLADFIPFLADEGKDHNTVQYYKDALLRRVFPYFMSRDRANPETWHEVSIHMRDYLRDQGCSVHQILRANNAARGFWEYHSQEGRIKSDTPPAFRNPKSRPKDTPLKKLLKPADVLRFVRNTTHTDIRLLALIGYFMSLRPQETIGLLVTDFRAGQQTEGLVCRQAMEQYGIYSDICVFVTRQVDNKNKVKDVKTRGSREWVAGFNREAGDTLFDLINSHENARLFPNGQNGIFKRWKALGIPDVTLKDLRRASLHYLGHEVGMKEIHLLKHARHASFETTLKYLRNPKTEAPAWQGKLVR